MTQVTQAGGDRQRDGSAGGNYLADSLLARRGFSAQSFDDMHGYFNEIARYVAIKNGAGLVELSQAGGWNKTTLYDGLHFSSAGSHRVAAIAAPVLAAEILRIRQDRQR
jgi:lysophospholipase L1-like esterase